MPSKASKSFKPEIDGVDAQAAPASFEAALEELEALAAEMEEGGQSLDGMLAHYRRAAYLLQHCRAQLQAVEDQVKVIDGLAGLPARADALEDAVDGERTA
jgi:exodeoxyribonuclease VII small subunit